MTLKNKEIGPTLRFTKMHGLGNDFIVINSLNQTFNSDQLAISALANRHTGIGFDQLLIIEPSKKADFFCRIFNADGSEATQCGNGLRCVAKLLQEENWIKESTVKIETQSGIYPISIQDDSHIKVTMGIPVIKERLLSLSVSANTIPTSIISLGNSHAIIKVNTVEEILINQLGADIASHPSAKEANVGFMEVIDPHHIRLRTFERGVGETHACGSNASAAVVAGITNGWLKNPVTVDVRYGSLKINWENDTLDMTGPAARVFNGELRLLK